MVPPLQSAGLYKGLRLLKDSIDSYRQRRRPLARFGGALVARDLIAAVLRAPNEIIGVQRARRHAHDA